ncbi:hypothetical protein TgHK011_007991 [Trichoderma gracile]|nr:hypothetical protein TgHK011_007991 [Trichoderma gracile]
MGERQRPNTVASLHFRSGTLLVLPSASGYSDSASGSRVNAPHAQHRIKRWAGTQSNSPQQQAHPPPPRQRTGPSASELASGSRLLRHPLLPIIRSESSFAVTALRSLRRGGEELVASPYSLNHLPWKPVKLNLLTRSFSPHKPIANVPTHLNTTLVSLDVTDGSFRRARGSTEAFLQRRPSRIGPGQGS